MYVMLGFFVFWYYIFFWMYCELNLLFILIFVIKKKIENIIVLIFVFN